MCVCFWNKKTQKSSTRISDRQAACNCNTVLFSSVSVSLRMGLSLCFKILCCTGRLENGACAICTLIDFYMRTVLSCWCFCCTASSINSIIIILISICTYATDNYRNVPFTTTCIWIYYLYPIFGCVSSCLFLQILKKTACHYSYVYRIGSIYDCSFRAQFYLLCPKSSNIEFDDLSEIVKNLYIHV